MDSTLTTGDRVFVNKLSYRLHDPNRGDVVVLHQINGAAERDLIKRVIALPGETIEMTNCEVRITEVDAPDADAASALAYFQAVDVRPDRRRSVAPLGRSRSTTSGRVSTPSRTTPCSGGTGPAGAST